MDIHEKKIIIRILAVVVVAASLNAWAIFTGHLPLGIVFGLMFGAVSAAALTAIPVALHRIKVT